MTRLTGLAAASAALAATPALAHHPLGGVEMTTHGQFLLSGIGHPLLGFDHLFFVIAVGVAAGLLGRALSLPLGYVAGMVGGLLAAIAGLALPGVEAAIALSLLALGTAVALGRLPGTGGTLVLFAGAGLFHGLAFSSSILGVEAAGAWTMVAAYALGLAAVQWAVAAGAGLLAGRAGDVVLPRLAGAAVAGAGAFLLLEHLEGAAFAALGIG